MGGSPPFIYVRIPKWQYRTALHWQRARLLGHRRPVYARTRSIFTHKKIKNMSLNLEYGKVATFV